MSVTFFHCVSSKGAMDKEIKLLVSGYITKNFCQQNDISLYPVALNNIIVKYLGMILLKFDVFTTKYEQKMIDKDGKIYDSDVVHGKKLWSSDYLNAGCSYSINHGITEINLKHKVFIRNAFPKCDSRFYISGVFSQTYNTDFAC